MPCDRLDDPAIRLMHHKPVDVLYRQSVQFQNLQNRFWNLAHCKFEHGLSVHMQETGLPALFAKRLALIQCLTGKYFSPSSVRSGNRKIVKPGMPLQHCRPGSISEQNAGAAVSPVDDL